MRDREARPGTQSGTRTTSSGWLSRLGRTAVGRLPGGEEVLAEPKARLRGDLVAGATVAAYLVPQVMAYAQLAGLPAVAGLWAMAAAIPVYAVLGSSPQLSVGPESTTALMTAVAIAPLAAGDPARAAALAAGLALLVGGCCLVGRLARLGFLSELLSKPVLTGYLAGVAVIMVCGQLGRLTGVEVAGDSAVQQVRSFVSGIDQVDPVTATVAGVTLVLLFGLRRLRPRAPGALLAVLVATALTALLELEERGVTTVGSVPDGLPIPAIPHVAGADLAVLLLPALGIAIVGYTDNILTGRAFADRAGGRVEPNRELLALGAANVGAGLVQGFPVSSSGSRTALGVASGARTQLSSLAALAVLVATLLALGPVLSAFPTAALGALIVFAAVQLVDVAEFRRFARFRRSEVVLALATTLGVLVVDILYGVLVAVALSILDLLRRVARGHDAVLGFVPGLAGMHDIDDYPQARPVPGLVVYRYDAPLCFANAEDFRRRALASAAALAPPVRWFVLNAEANVEIDITAADAVEDVRADLAARGVVFAMARVKQDLFDVLVAGGLVERVGADRIFPTLPSAVSAYEAWLRAQPATAES